MCTVLICLRGNFSGQLLCLWVVFSSETMDSSSEPQRKIGFLYGFQDLKKSSLWTASPTLSPCFLGSLSSLPFLKCATDSQYLKWHPITFLPSKFWWFSKLSSNFPSSESFLHPFFSYFGERLPLRWQRSPNVMKIMGIFTGHILAH